MVRYGLIGKSLGHSFSAEYFSRKFRQEGIDAEYSLFPLLHTDDIIPLINETPDLQGLNVTIPYKQSVIEVLKRHYPAIVSLTKEAEEVGAVNTLRFCRDEKGKILSIEGHNTDVEGFKESISGTLLTRPDVGRALILGATGGAARAVAYVLQHFFHMKITGVARSPQHFKAGFSILGYEDVDEKIIEENRLIVNCTPLGMWPDIQRSPEIPYHFLSPLHVGYDLIYNPSETLFLRHFTDAGATALNGLDMLHLQAEASYRFWTDNA